MSCGFRVSSVVPLRLPHLGTLPIPFHNVQKREREVSTGIGASYGLVGYGYGIKPFP